MRQTATTDFRPISAEEGRKKLKRLGGSDDSTKKAKPSKKKPSKETIECKTIASEMAYNLHKTFTRKQLFAIAGPIGASKDSDKWETAKNIGKKLAEPQFKTTITISYVR